MGVLRFKSVAVVAVAATVGMAAVSQAATITAAGSSLGVSSVSAPPLDGYVFYAAITPGFSRDQGTAIGVSTGTGLTAPVSYASISTGSDHFASDPGYTRLTIDGTLYQTGVAYQFPVGHSSTTTLATIMLTGTTGAAVPDFQLGVLEDNTSSSNTGGNNQVTSITAVGSNSASNPDSATSEQNGLYFFNVTGATVGDTITINITNGSGAVSGVLGGLTFQALAAPEPASLGLLAVGGLGLLARRRRA